MYKNIKRAFTLIELIMTIAVLGILILIAAPKIINQVDKAELTRIQHDIGVMEKEVELAIINNDDNYDDWDDNETDLGKLVLSKKLYDKKGLAESVEKSHLMRYYEMQRNNIEDIGMGGELHTIAALDDADEEPVEESQHDILVSMGYKVIPQDYSEKIKTQLDGVFYANEDGKVYYEHDRVLRIQKEEIDESCDAPSAEDLGYVFEIVDGKGEITSYDNREKNVVIPSVLSTEEDGEKVCNSVESIGVDSFSYNQTKEFKIESIEIPTSIKIIKEGAFKNNSIEKVTIPSSVTALADTAFVGNGLKEITVRGSQESSPLNETNSQGADVKYNYGTPSELGIIFDYNSGTIIHYFGGNGPLGNGKESSISVPEYVTDKDGQNYKVKSIAKGAYQGQRLVGLTLPNTLERIEDYAFSGNKLTDIIIPNSVIHIGDYAFSFNEKVDSETQKKKPTITSIIMNDEEQIDKVDKFGNILETPGGLKVNKLAGKLRLQDNIFITSINNNVEMIDEKESEADAKNEIVFSGLDYKAWDGNVSTSTSIPTGARVRWEGDLAHKEINIRYYLDRYENISFTFYNEDGSELRSPSYPDRSRIYQSSGSNGGNYNIKAIVPSDATSIKIDSSDSSNKILELTYPEELNEHETQEITTSADSKSITLNWEQAQRVIIIKNNKKLADSFTNSYTDEPLQPGSSHTYKVLFVDEYGNGSNDYYEVKEETENVDIKFSGLGPAAWDGNTISYENISGTRDVTWTGNLNNKEISIRYYLDRYENISFKFLDKNGTTLHSPSYNSGSQYYHSTSNSSSTSTVRLIVPTGATRLRIYSSDSSNRMYEITPPSELNSVQTQKITTSSDSKSITLNWDQRQRAIVMKGNKKVMDSTTNSYTESPLHPGSTHTYRVLFLDAHGNGADNYSEVTETTESRDIMFSGLGPAAWDGNTSSYENISGTRYVTWTGDLNNKEISIRHYLDRYENISFKFLDNKGTTLHSPSYNSGSQYYRSTSNSSSTSTVRLIVPTGATRLSIYSSDSSNRLHEITPPSELNSVQTQKITTSSDSKSITLNWDKIQRAIVMKGNKKVMDSTTNSYTESPLHPGSTHTYRVLFLDAHGNGADNYSQVTETTESRDIMFSGLGPAAWDGNTSSYENISGTRYVTWTGDLNNKEISIRHYLDRYENISFKFLDNKGTTLHSPSYNSGSQYYRSTSNSSSTSTVRLIVPTGATRLSIYSSDSSNRLHEITPPSELNSVQTQKITTSSDSKSITLNWDKTQRAIVMKGNKKVMDSTTNSYTENPLHPGSTHTYRVLFLDAHGNGADNYSQVTETTESRDIMFSGLGPAAWDGNTSSYENISGTRYVTWTGDLNNKEISIRHYLDRYENISFKFLDNKGTTLHSPSYNSGSQYYRSTSNSSSTSTVRLIVPTGATRLSIYSSDSSNRLHEITPPSELNSVQTQKITTSSDSKSITLNWDQRQRAIVMKGNKKVMDSTTNSYTESPLHPGSTHTYRVLFLDAHGNGADNYSQVAEKTKSRDIMFSGLGPAAWDGNTSSYENISGTRYVTWTGDLNNKEISIRHYLDRYENISLKFLDKNGTTLHSPSYNNGSQYYRRTSSSSSTSTVRLIVPTGATRLSIYSSDSSNRVYEITAAGNFVVD